MKAKIVDSNGSLGPRRPISKNSGYEPASEPAVAINEDGLAYILWRHRIEARSSERLMFRGIDPAGTLLKVRSGPQGLLQPEIRYFDLAVNTQHRLLFIWHQGPGARTIKLRSWQRSTFYEPAEVVYEESSHAGSSSIVLDEDGDAALVWVGHDGSDYFVRGRTRSADGTYEAVTTLGPSLGPAPPATADDYPWFYGPALGLGGSGEVATIWTDPGVGQRASFTSI